MGFGSALSNPQTGKQQESVVASPSPSIMRSNPALSPLYGARACAKGMEREATRTKLLDTDIADYRRLTGETIDAETLYAKMTAPSMPATNHTLGASGQYYQACMATSTIMRERFFKSLDSKQK